MGDPVADAGLEDDADHERDERDERQVHEAPERVPLGRAVVRRRDDDVTVVATGVMVSRALDAAERLSTSDGVDATVVGRGRCRRSTGEPYWTRRGRPDESCWCSRCERVGDPFAVGEVVCGVLTDEVDVEVDSPVGGVQERIVAGAHDTVPVGQPLAFIRIEAGDLLAGLLDSPLRAVAAMTIVVPADYAVLTPMSGANSGTDRDGTRGAPSRATPHRAAPTTAPTRATPHRAAPTRQPRQQCIARRTM